VEGEEGHELRASSIVDLSHNLVCDGPLLLCVYGVKYPLGNSYCLMNLSSSQKTKFSSEMFSLRMSLILCEMILAIDFVARIVKVGLN
jgi:hypothetical protein